MLGRTARIARARVPAMASPARRLASNKPGSGADKFVVPPAPSAESSSNKAPSSRRQIPSVELAAPSRRAAPPPPPQQQQQQDESAEASELEDAPPHVQQALFERAVNDLADEDLAKLNPLEYAEVTEDRQALEYGTDKSTTAGGHYDILRPDSTYDGLEKLYFNQPLSPQSPPRPHGSEVMGFESGWLNAGQDPQSIRWRSLEQFYHPNAVRERAAQAAVDLWLEEQEEAANSEKAAGEVVDWMGGTADGVLGRAEALVDENLQAQNLTREDISPEDLDALRDEAVDFAMAELRAVAPEGVNKAVLLDLRAKYTLLYEHMELVARHRLDAIRKRHLDPSASPVNWRAVGALMGRRGRALDQWAEYMAGLSETMIEEKRDTIDALLDLQSAERELADQKDRLKPDQQFAEAVKQDNEDGASKVKGDLAALRALENREHAATKPFEYLSEDVLALLSPAEKTQYEAARAAHEAATPRWKRARRERERGDDDLRRLEAEDIAANQRFANFADGKNKRGGEQQSAEDEEAARLRRSEFKPSDFIPYSRDYINGLMTFPLLMRRTTQQTGKGKINSSYALVVVGNGAGLVGVGEGKDYDTPARARDKAIADAVRNMDVVERFEDRTIWTEVQSKMGATRIILRPRPVGFGLHCNPYIHQILKAAGIKDVSAKVWGSRNPLNVIKTVQRMLHAGHAPVRFGSGTMGAGGRRTEAFSGIRGKDAVERERGRKLVPGRAW